jgi:hypothetical protein
MLPGMIRDAVVHMNNEQPLLADLRALPTASDACLVCTNLRYLNGKKPTFTDAIDSWFLLPLGMVRFVEVPASSIAKSEMLALPAGEIAAEEPEPAAVEAEFRPSLEYTPEDGEDLMDLESENELLRRMREV